MPVSPHPDLGGDLTKLVIGAAMTFTGLSDGDWMRRTMSVHCIWNC
ncbi:MAG TPA: hypothetical protein PLB55_16920 [Prosthecobacter sp.]|nr:hypothetical protein [Prosthecobacter sp.]